MTQIALNSPDVRPLVDQSIPATVSELMGVHAQVFQAGHQPPPIYRPKQTRPPPCAMAS